MPLLLIFLTPCTLFLFTMLTPATAILCHTQHLTSIISSSLSATIMFVHSSSAACSSCCFPFPIYHRLIQMTLRYYSLLLLSIAITITFIDSNTRPCVLPRPSSYQSSCWCCLCCSNLMHHLQLLLLLLLLLLLVLDIGQWFTPGSRCNLLYPMDTITIG